MLEQDNEEIKNYQNEKINKESSHLPIQSTLVEQHPSVWFSDISDALCEKDRVHFTVRSYRGYDKDIAREKPPEVVRRYHEDFVWLYDTLTENEDYAGLIIPPVPYKPNFNDLRMKLNKLVELEGSIDSERYAKMKKEVDEEYCSKFKKAVYNHENFLHRLAESATFSRDENFIIFLSFEGSLDVRGKNKKEVFSDFLKFIADGADKLFRPNQKDANDFFNRVRSFLDEYVHRITEVKRLSGELSKSSEEVCSAYMQSYAAIDGMKSLEKPEFAMFLQRMSTALDDIRKLENKAVENIDFKLYETFRYVSKESAAAVNLLYRRYKALNDFETSNHAVDKARLKKRDIAFAESEREKNKEKFDKISSDAKGDLQQFTKRRFKLISTQLKEFASAQALLAEQQVNALDVSIASLKSAKAI